MTARKILRRSKPHGPRGKRIEPTVEQGFKDIEDDIAAAWDEVYDGEFDDFMYDASQEEANDREWDEYWAQQDDQGLSEIDLIGGES